MCLCIRVAVLLAGDEVSRSSVVTLVSVIQAGSQNFTFPVANVSVLGGYLYICMHVMLFMRDGPC